MSTKQSAIKINAELRTESGKSSNKVLRRNGLTPGIIYGPDLKKNVAISFESKELIKVLKQYGESHQIDIAVDGKNYNVIVKDFNYNILSSTLIHVDFYQVSKSHAIKTSIPIRFEGVSKGEKGGGIVEKFIHHIQMEGKIADLPEEVVINMDDLNVGTKIHIRDISVPKKVKVLDNEDEVILVIKGHVEEVTAGETPEEAMEKAKAAEIFDD